MVPRATLYVRLLVVYQLGASCRYRALRLHPSSLFIWRGAADLGCCAVIIASLLYRRFASPQTTDVSHCRALSFFNEVFSVAAEGFFLCLALDLREGITSPFTNYRVMMQYCQAAVVLVSLVFGMLLLLGNDEDQPLYGEDNYLSVCWIKRFRKHSSTTSPYFWVMFALPLAAMYSVALWAFATSRTRLLHGLRSTFQNRMTAYANSLWFIMTYVLYWSLIGVLYSVAYFVNDIDPPVAVNCLLALMVGGRGVVTLFVWMYIQDVKEAVVQDASERGGISSVEDLRPKLNLAMRTEIITYASKGIQLSARKAAQSPGHLDVTSGAWRYNVVWLPRDEEVRLTGCLLRLVLPLRDTNSPRDPSVRVAHVHYYLFPDKDSSAILAQAPLPVSAPIPVHPPVLPEFGAIGTLTRSRAEEVAFSGAHAPVRLLSPLPNHARASNSWKSYPAGILSSAAVGSASSAASGVDLAAVPASPTPSPQTLNAATSDRTCCCTMAPPCTPVATVRLVCLQRRPLCRWALSRRLSRCQSPLTKLSRCRHRRKGLQVEWAQARASPPPRPSSLTCRTPPCAPRPSLVKRKWWIWGHQGILWRTTPNFWRLVTFSCTTPLTLCIPWGPLLPVRPNVPQSPPGCVGVGAAFAVVGDDVCGAHHTSR
jgi:hypothetical protein